ncbi:RNA polymerase sigma factor [Paenibacillus vietnamensis]|uniref:RNA polymerase sigma factor n=1 Tax=Paenibacillus vietnamensis TaxID=2590547 RepID=UPI001CD1726E|nr:sigma factor-like helix-turn-helix DNA-binding protein [Paenibacillus vietnamensis]
MSGRIAEERPSVSIRLTRRNTRIRIPPKRAPSGKQAISLALTQLTAEQQTVIELRIIQGYSVAETAGLMNKQEVAVRVMQHRALHHLAAIMLMIHINGFLAG